MRSIGGVIAVLLVLVAIGLVVLRQTQVAAPTGRAASGAAPAGPAERARTAQERAAADVAKAMDAASASRGAAQGR